MEQKSVDAVLVVVEATPRSIQVGRRAAELARDRSLGTVLVVANRIRTAEELATISAAFPDSEIVGIPDDEAIVRAERAGVAPLDSAPDAPAVQALVALAHRLPG